MSNFLKGKQYPSFPVDRYFSAVCIAYAMADVPLDEKTIITRTKKGLSTDPVQSVRFLFAHRQKDNDGNIIVVRKWSEWMALSYANNSKLMKTMGKIENLESFLSDDESLTSGLFGTIFKLFVEVSNKDSRYSDITKIQKITSEEARDLNLDMTIGDIVYDKEFTPLKYIKIFKFPKVFQTVCVIKTIDGIKVFKPEDMIDPEELEKNRENYD